MKHRYHELQKRRYIGNKQKLLDWIFGIIIKECQDCKSFADIFAGTAVISSEAIRHYERVVINDFLHSNNVIYKAFFGTAEYDEAKIADILNGYNEISPDDLDENYFSINFGGKYFSHDTSKVIGYIREDIQKQYDRLSGREHNILIASLIYSADKIANTVGHYDAYVKKGSIEDKFLMKLINPLSVETNIEIFREDVNRLASQIDTDIVYIDPPYNTRQYSRFYHVLETLTKWDKPKLHGVALKPELENMSDYCKVRAGKKLYELVHNIKTKYFVVSYNNTYDSKSYSSKNKITLEEMEEILSSVGSMKIFEKEHQQFTTGKTEFKDHREYLFVTKVKDS